MNILCIDTALEVAGIGIAHNGSLVASRYNHTQMDHAAWIHTSIKEVLKDTGVNWGDFAAVAVTSGPGSYTGLRVGMATAKGLCYSLNLPLITENILKLTAIQVKREFFSENLLAEPQIPEFSTLFCPMVDARRMEVFTAMYDQHLEVFMPPTAMVLNENSFQGELDQHRIIFCGNGANKWNKICIHRNGVYLDTLHKLDNLAEVAQEKCLKGVFADLAYSEPDYFKNFYGGK